MFLSLFQSLNDFLIFNQMFRAKRPSQLATFLARLRRFGYMDWNVFFTTATPFVVAVIGGLVAHWLTIWRDRRNKKREQRIQYLIEAYRFLAKGTHNPKLYEVADEVQSAISDIQLFGTDEQIELGRKFVMDLANNKTAEIDELLNALRDDLREELKLSKAPEKLYWLRIEESKKTNNQITKAKQ